MRKMTRFVWALALVASLAGCKPKDKATHITLSSWGDTKEAIILQDLCRMFEQSNPGLKVDLQRVPYGEYNSKLLTEFSAGMVPDVIFGGTGQLPEFYPRGILEPLNDFLKGDPDVKLADFYPQALDPFTIHGKIYALPRDISVIGIIFYNKALFQKAGLPNPSDDWNWDDFLQAAQKLTARDAKGNVTCWGYVDDWLAAEPWFMSLGADYTDDWQKNTRYTIDDPNFAKGLQFRNDLTYKYKVTPSQPAIMALGGGSLDLFLNGQAGMFFSGIWQTPKLRDIQTFDWDCVMFPKGPTGLRGFRYAMSGYGISSTSKHKPEAWKLLKFLVGEEGQKWFSKTALAQPAVIKVAESPAFLDGQKPLNKKMLLKAMPYGKWEPFALNWREVQEGVIQPELDRLWNNTKTVQETIDAISAKLKDHPLKLPE